MFETALRRNAQVLQVWLGQKIAPWANANTVTLIAFISGILSGFCIAVHCQWTAFFFLMISGLCDALDGTVARLTGTASELGAFCDLVSDRMVESAIMAGIAWGYPQYSFVTLLFMIALLLHFSTFGIAASLFKNTSEKSLHYNKSMVERVDAFLVFGIIILFPWFTAPVLMGLNIVMFVDGVLRFKAIMNTRRESSGLLRSFAQLFNKLLPHR